MASEYAQHLLSRIANFVSGDVARGLFMIVSGLIAFLWANSPWAYAYIALSETHLGLGFGAWRTEESLVEWVNDGSPLLLLILFIWVL